MNLENLTDLLPLLACYAETHYRFKYFPLSLYYRRAPEVIFDAPFRLEPGIPLPVVLIIKDADRFPVNLEKVEIEVDLKDKSGMVIRKEFNLNEKISKSLWFRVFDVEVDTLGWGNLVVKAEALIENRGQRKRVSIDNYFRLPKQPLQVYLAETGLPVLPGWYPGELHCHTAYGIDQVEFGAPLPVIKQLAERIGLNWVALTDHSYNLDDYPNNYLKSDPVLNKWRAFWEEIEQLNSKGGVILIPGEEVTCRNAKGRNVHLVILGNTNFIPGSGDSAEKWFRTFSENSVDEALSKLTPEACAIAAHPLSKTPFLEWLLVHRGQWKLSDLNHPKLNGWQIVNGIWNNGFKAGLKTWREAILKGQKITILAGDDAHGNFNFFRQVKLPMIKLWHHRDNIFGRFRTYLKIKGSLNPNAVLKALRTGASIISDGPIGQIQILEGNQIYEIGDVVNLKPNMEILITWHTTSEFGKLRNLRLLTANMDKEINLLDKISPSKWIGTYGGTLKLPATGQKYLRAEIETIDTNENKYYSYINPIWLKNQK